jgi:hypothetical protein
MIMLANGDGSMQHGNNETNNITPMEHRRFVSAVADAYGSSGRPGVLSGLERLRQQPVFRVDRQRHSEWGRE